MVDATTGERVGEPIAGAFSAGRESVAVAVSGDESLLAIGGGGVVYVLDAETGDQLFEVRLASAATSMVFDDTTQELIVGASLGELVTIDLASREIVSEVSNSTAASVRALEIGAEGLVTTFSTRRIELIDRATGPTGTVLSVQGLSARVQPDGNVLVFAPDDFFEVWAISE